MSKASLPGEPVLQDGLSAALGRPVRLLKREGNPYAGSVRSEIITCTLDNTAPIRLFCKYEARETQSWSNVAYEAVVYERVLTPHGAGAPLFYGTYRDGVPPCTWLILEHIDDACLLDDLEDESTMSRAAQWLGTFHARTAPLVTSGMTDVKRQDADFYLGYARRAAERARGGAVEYRWLSRLHDACREYLPAAFTTELCLTHGDYYPHNILVQGERICPVDWESAAVELGEIDLATLVAGLTDRVARACEHAYIEARWPAGAPADAAERVLIGTLCLCVYNLGAHGDWTASGDGQWYARRARALGEELGLI